MKAKCKKALCVLLTFFMLLPFSLFPGFADAEAPESEARSIAIVFDNSGSMYVNGDGTAWCRATYAMEVFASMMNEKDTLWIYPMWPIQVNGEVYSMDKPLKLAGKKDAPSIRGIYTPLASGTPIDAIDKAAEGLRSVSGQKWLIVLTDGDTNWHQRVADDPEDLTDLPNPQTELENRLNAYNREMNVLYLGIRTMANPIEPKISDGGSYLHHVDVASDSKQVLAKLTSMCNMIFGRDALPNPGSSVNLPVSMKQIFVFVQGDQISDVTMKSTSGAVVRSGDTNFAPKYSEKGCGGNRGFKVDESLQGVIATFVDLEKGQYTLEYKGTASSIEIYYEPNVDISPVLINPAGRRVENESDLIPGEYTLSYGLLDGETKEPADMSLLGNIEFTLDCQRDGKPLASGGASGEEKFMMDAGNTLDLKSVDVTFLHGYHIHKEGHDLGFPWNLGSIQVNPMPAGELRLELDGGQSTCHLSQIEQEGSYSITVFYDGDKLTGEELRAVDLQPQLSGDGLRVVSDLKDDCVGLQLTYADPAHPENTACGDYSLTVNASYTPPDTETAIAAPVSSPFYLENDVTGLSAELTLPDGGHTRAELSDADVYVSLRMGGEPLSPEEMANLEYQILISGANGDIPFTVEKDESGSRLALHLDPSQAPMGAYEVKVLATTRDKLGQEVRATDEGRIKLQALPTWLMLVIILGAIALLAGLIAFILTRKVLPAKAAMENVAFYLNGEEFSVNGYIAYSGAWKHHGSLSFSHSTPPTDPTAGCGFTMELTANTTLFTVLMSRITKSSSGLSAIRTSIHSDPNVQSIRMGATTNFEGGEPVVARVGQAQTPKISANVQVSITGTSTLGNTMQMQGRLRFK